MSSLDQDKSHTKSLKDRTLVRLISNISVAAVSSTSAVILAFPCQRLPLLLSRQNTEPKTFFHELRRFAQALTMSTHIIKSIGIKGLWRSCATHILAILPSQVLPFALNDVFSTRFQNSFRGLFFSGGLAGLCSSVVLYPFDYIRLRRSLELGHGIPQDQRKFKIISSAFSRHWKTGKLLELYRGFLGRGLIAFLYRGTYFGGYAKAKQLIDSDNFLGRFLAAYIASTLAELISYPLIVIRRETVKDAYAMSMIQCAKDIAQRKGLQGFIEEAALPHTRVSGTALMLVFYDYLAQYVANTRYFAEEKHQCYYDVKDDVFSTSGRRTFDRVKLRQRQ
eukprot:TRINITY_DN7493_c0_g2_i1.p1 TRINITY_DN7493_c0_g2~~TRINITY_DN7493_c0_g2_i1.p1  ORF type:complete len:336 (-),score=2.96 TRINITY_DN7493_c0_g2_i1:136-1143(-)